MNDWPDENIHFQLTAPPQALHRSALPSSSRDGGALHASGSHRAGAVGFVSSGAMCSIASTAHQSTYHPRFDSPVLLEVRCSRPTIPATKGIHVLGASSILRCTELDRIAINRAVSNADPDPTFWLCPFPWVGLSDDTRGKPEHSALYQVSQLCTRT